MTNTNDITSLIHATQAVALKLIESEGEVTEKIQRDMLDLGKYESALCDYYASLLDELKLREAFLTDREHTYQTYRKSAQKAQDWLKTQLKLAMEHLRKKELHGLAHTLKRSERGLKVVVYNEELLPDEFKIIKMSESPNLDLIQKTIEAGNEVPGCHIEPVVALLNTVNKKGALNESI